MTPLESIRAELDIERQRIISSFTAPQTHKGIMVHYLADCHDECPDTVISNAKQIMQVINETSQAQWHNVDEWISMLPTYVTDSFSSAIDEHDEWSLEGWLYWFELEHRAWFLWEIEAVGDSQLQISIWIYEHPFPSEALEVLFMKLGTGQLTEIGIH
ncbi:hypothetical protein [Paenibacillus kandeliae]|uniref:hypothetical protein n=1 Tax=Paenibacillus kandeliae TaxID=3231269 RepID=UPI00345A3ACF